MGNLRVLSGDWKTGGGSSFSVNTFSLKRKDGGYKNDERPAHEIKSLEIITEEAKKRIVGTVAGGAIGGALLGPVGLVAGALVSGNGSEVTFVATFKAGGGKLIATTDTKTFQKIQISAGLL